MLKTSLRQLVLCAGTLLISVPMTVAAADIVTLENVQEPAANRKEEPKAAAFSLERAVHFLDSAAVDWQKQRKCFTCHTNYAFLYARPAISAENETHRTVRQYAEELVRDRWPDKGPRWDAEVVATAAALAFNDAATTKKLHPVTKQALDKMWTLQRADGGWDWLKCDWPPMESDDHYGATLAAIAVGVAPEDYARTPAAQAGLAKLVEYLKANPAPTVHHQAMQLWASVYVEQLLGKDDREQKNEREKIVAKIWSLQRADGGWNLASLGDWQRGDKSPQDTESSDGYATGFLTYVLRMAGTPAGDERLRKAVTWLKSNQRESGRWFTRSLHADGKHFISHAGTAFAIMAIAAADSDPVGAPPLRSN